MSSIKFGSTFSLLTAATPSTGWLVAYDVDGILKQKDSNGVIIPIGGGPTAGLSSTASLSQTLAIGNDSAGYSIIMGTSTNIRSAQGGGQLQLDYASDQILLSTDNGAFSQTQLYLTNGYTELSDYSLNSEMLINAYRINITNGFISTPTGNYILLNSSVSDGKLFLGVGGEDVIKISATQGFTNITTNTNKYGTIISSRNSYFDETVRNSAIIGGQDITAILSNSVYVPTLVVSENGTVGLENGTSFLQFNTDILDLESTNGIIALSTSTASYLKNGIFVLDTTNQTSTPVVSGGVIYINTENSSASASIVNVVVIGGQNLNATQSDTVYLGNNVNINGSYTLPSTDGTAGYVLKTDGSGNVSWQSDAGATIPTLYQVLSQGNDSQIRNIIMGTGTYIKSGNGGGRIDLDFTSSSGQIMISTDDASLSQAYILLDNNDISVQSAGLIDIVTVTSNISVGDGSGLRYSTDYSAGFVDRSLIDKGYVDSGTNSIWNYIADVATGSAVQNYVPKWKLDHNLAGTTSIYIDDEIIQYSLKGTIGVGTTPESVAFDSYNYRIYAVNSASDNVTVIDSENYQVIGTVSVGNHPVSIAFDSFNNRMYVTNRDDDTVSVINTSNNTVISTISVGNYPLGIHFDQYNNLVYVSNQLANTISVIDTSTNTVTSTLSANTPRGLVYHSTNNRLYVAGVGPDKVAVLDTTINTITATVSVGTNPYGLALDTYNNRIYVTNYISNSVSVINASNNTVVTTISVGTNPDGIVFDSVNQKMYVSNTGNGTISVIDTNTYTVVSTITVTNAPKGLAFDFINQKVFAANSTTNLLNIINASYKPDGYVGISTINPTSELDVRGKITTTEFRLTTGANDGYYLVSDSLGNATWQYPIIELISGTGLTGGGTSGVVSISVNLGQNSGLTFSGDNIIVDTNSLSTALEGSGLTSNGGQLSVNVGNGLSIVSDSVYLGGTLSQNTLINGNYQTFGIRDTANMILTASGSGYSAEFGYSDSLEYNIFYGDEDKASLWSWDGTNTVEIATLTSDTLVGDGTINNRLVVTDNVYNKGLIYDGDYTSNFTTYSLVTKGYVDNIAGGIGVENGIVEITSGTFALGGTLSQNTTISGNLQDFKLSGTNYIELGVSGSNSLKLRNNNGNYDTTLLVDAQPTYGFAVSTIFGGNTYSYLSANESQIKLLTVDGSLMAQMWIEINNTPQVVNDGSTDNTMIIRDGYSKGLVYKDDYTANFTTYSLVTKGYVDSVASSIGATNGLTEISSGIIGLGGTLSQTTTIDLSSYNFTMNTSNSEINLNRGSSIYPGVTNSLRVEDKYSEVRAKSSLYDSYVRVGNENNSQAEVSLKVNLGTYSNRQLVSQNNILSEASSTDGLSISSIAINSIPVSVNDLSTDNILVVTDGISSKGLVYLDDYSSNFTDYSLVTKGYVDTVSTSKYSEVRGFTASITETISHNLGTDEIIVQAYDSSGIMVIPGVIQINGVNNVDVTFSKTISNIKIVIIG